ncbi:MAG: ATP-grasp domain-containing protein [Butyrivibrio sp.]|nr:ATP-grasp domain-containing protein [Butyrivibrio sp.]
MARVMVVAGGDWQIELIKRIKEKGHFVICSNLYEDSPAFKYADACEVSDVLDKEKNLEIAKKYNIDACLSDQSDIAVPTVAYINEKLGLNGIGTKLAELFTDKSMQRSFCKENGIKIPDYVVCENDDDAVSFFKKYKKIIIKPIDSQSSRGVHTIENLEDLSRYYKDAIKWSNKKKAFLAEEYIEGDEFTIDGLVVNGHHYPLCISIKEMYKNNTNISKCQSYSYYSDKYDYDKLRRENKRLFESANLKMGLTHSEYKAFDGDYYLIEAGARGGGSNLSAKIVPFMSGIDNYNFLIEEALGCYVEEKELVSHQFPSNRYVIMRFFDFGTGKVKHVNGIEAITESPMLIDYQWQVKVGDYLSTPEYGRLRPGHFIIGGDEKSAVEQEADRILESVCVITE